MKKLYLFVLIPFIFLSCAKENPGHNPLKNELLAYTQKFEKIQESYRFLATGTYLNPVFKDFEGKNKEYFILSIYPLEEKLDLSTVRINNKLPLSVKEISDDEFAKLSPVKIYWAKHYKITASEMDSKTLNLTFKAGKTKALKISSLNKLSITILNFYL